MTVLTKIARAVRNNAAWCDATCRSRGAAGEFHESFWLKRGEVPPYTSRFVTLGGPEHAETQLAALRRLMAVEAEAFSVKDAFQCLDLAPLGFGVFFEATWIEWLPGATPPFDAEEQLAWSVVQDSDELREWELAWRGSPANRAAEGEPRVFAQTLLGEPGFHFLAGRRAGVVVASAALNRTGDVVGLSNVFSGVAEPGPLFPGCMRLARELYPQVPIVGYERGPDLIAAEKAGFARVHGLTVWQRR